MTRHCLQLDALQAGCETVFRDTISGARPSDRAHQALDHVRNGDMLVVWRLDRLVVLSHLIELIQTLEGHGVGFKSLTEQIDTTTSGGKLIFHIFGCPGRVWSAT
jgi:DNA invertase Pin-like site-specific DNA recombinase